MDTNRCTLGVVGGGGGGGSSGRVSPLLLRHDG
jgi:hypothetical protein